MTAALFIFGLLNAAVYSSLLPLWEGFDEAYHYGYIEYLATQGRFPVLDRTLLSDQVWDSIVLAPASHVVRRYTPQVTAFDEYARLSAEEGRRRRARLQALEPSLRGSYTRGGANYEAQQAPLAYLLLAPWDRLWSRLPLPDRIWRLRMICSLASTVTIGWSTLWLAARFGLTAGWRHAALFLLFSTQMLYAANAHIANDWLAIALLPCLMVAATRFHDRPGAGRAAWLGAALAAALLAKAYFLVFVPFAGLFVLWVGWRYAPAFLAALAVAAPWYVRNVVLYGNVTGLQTGVSQIASGAVSRAFLEVPWQAALPAAARGAIWTGNGSFLTFSSLTLNVMLALVAVALALWMARRAWRPTGGLETCPTEWIAAFGAALQAFVLVYAIATFYVLDKSAVSGPTPWYAPGIFPAVLCLALVGLSRSGRPGRVMLAAMLCLWTYTISATWLVKLIPWYAGFGARGTAANLWVAYSGGRLIENLDAVSLAAAGPTLVAAGVVAVAAVILCGSLIYATR